MYLGYLLMDKLTKQSPSSYTQEVYDDILPVSITRHTQLDKIIRQVM